MSSNNPNNASLIVAATKTAVPLHLNTSIAALAQQAIAARGAFTVALSGGSLPSFLATLDAAFTTNGTAAAQWDKWHVLLADERCVPESNPDSNLGSIRQHFLSVTQIPESQIYGIDEGKLGNTDAVAVDYEAKLTSALSHSGGLLDCAVLGFGPDGHTCSLFPGHDLLQERTRLVAGITDSPKPPPQRITLTYKVLNRMTRHVIVCGAGASKGPILEKVVIVTVASVAADANYKVADGTKYAVQIQRNPAPFPCAMVEPNLENESTSLTWIVDADAVQTIKGLA